MSIMSDVHSLISTIKASVSNSVADVSAQFTPSTTEDNLKADKEALMNKTLAERFVLSHVKSYVEKRLDELKDIMTGLATDLVDTNVSIMPGARHVVYEDDRFIYQVNMRRSGKRLDTQKLKIELTRKGWSIEEIDALVDKASNESAPQTIHEIIPK